MARVAGRSHDHSATGSVVNSAPSVGRALLLHLQTCFPGPFALSVLRELEAVAPAAISPLLLPLTPPSCQALKHSGWLISSAPQATAPIGFC